MLVVVVIYLDAEGCAHRILVFSSVFNFVHELLQDQLLSPGSQSIENLAKRLRIVYVIPLLQVDIVEDVLNLLVCEYAPKCVLHAVLQTQVKVRLQKQVLKFDVLRLGDAASHYL